MLTIAIIGRPNVGKSTLFNRLVGRRVAITLMEPGTTRDRIIQQGEWLNRKFWVIDTGGLVTAAQTPIEKEIETQVELAIQEADIALLLVDAREGLNPVDVELADRLKRRKTRFVLVVNKVDDPANRRPMARPPRVSTAGYVQTASSRFPPNTAMAWVNCLTTCSRSSRSRRRTRTARGNPARNSRPAERRQVIAAQRPARRIPGNRA